MEVKTIAPLISQILEHSELPQVDPLWLNPTVRHFFPMNFMSDVIGFREPTPSIRLFTNTSRLLCEFSHDPLEISSFLQTVTNTWNTYPQEPRLDVMPDAEPLADERAQPTLRWLLA
jgi:hypothetical protein